MNIFKKYNNNKKQRNIVNIIILLIFVMIISLTIGFSTMYSSLDIGELAAYFRINKDIRVTNITLDKTEGNAISNWEEYDHNSISANISLPNSNSEVTYEVEITNLGNIEMGILDITGLQSNLKYTIDNYTIKDMLCDSVNPSECKLGSKSYIKITFSYNDNSYNSTNTDFNVKLNFDFKRFYSISYINIDDTNLPKNVMESDDLEIQLNNPFPDKINITGNLNASYNSSNGKVKLLDVDDDIVLSYYAISYFVAYDGSSTKLFDTFTKTNIISFSRNTSLSLNEVMQKVNNSTAYKISTDKGDPNYPSKYDIYAWVEDNNLYWWSEASEVYYHPDTLGAFRQMTNLLTVDLNGTNTSLVKNFAHWFDKDAKLTTINGKINTSGLVLQYNPSFNYGNDQDENSSSGYGLTYMFNDCKVLTSIDTSEIYTDNSSDLKRMFGGCAKLTTLDLSHFNTTNAKSMYWMFRKNEKLEELDLRSFDTSNVESMFGMFVSTTNLKTIYLGENFNTSSVKQFNRMFESANNLKTVYAYNDFDLSSKVTDSNMFINAKKIIGSDNTLDATPYDSTHINSLYARLAHNGTKGYLTPYGEEYYTITYELNGATNNNPNIYTENTETFTLQRPTKKGYIFTGWTGSNGDIPQLDVTIFKGSSGNRHYVANFEKSDEDLFPKVFSIEGSCNFNGSNSNITGETCFSSLDDHTNYTNSTYIDTNINLYNQENYEKDYEIYFEISNYNPNEQENPPNCKNQNTIMNTKIEGESNNNPGLVLRKNGSSFELKSFSSTNQTHYANVTSYRIVRIDKKIYYSVNDGNLTLLDDNTTFNSPFDLSVWFGASKDSDGNAFRHVKCTLSNIYIRLGTFS